MIKNRVALAKGLQISACFAIGSVTIMLAYINRSNGAVSLIFDKSDIYMDLVNTIFDSCRPDAYTSLGNIYPPALMSLLRFIFTSACNESLATAKQLRTEILGALMFIHFMLIFLSGIMLGGITWTLRKNRIITCVAAIMGSIWPPLVFGIDRMNLILVPYFILLLSVLVSLSLTRQDKEKLAIWNTLIYWTILLAVIVKPYFILAYGLIFTSDFLRCRTSASARCILALKFGLGFLIIILINMQPFIAGTYAGSVISWLNNLFNFQGIVSSNASNIWNMNYYSLSTFAASKLFPAANMPEFLNQPVIGNNLLILVIGLSIQLIFTILMLSCLAKLMRITYLKQAIHEASIGIMAEFSILTMSLVIISSLFTSFGYYSGIFWVILATNALCFGNRAECTIISILSLLFMALSSSSTSIWASSSIPASACLYVLMAFSASTIIKRVEVTATQPLPVK